LLLRARHKLKNVDKRASLNPVILVIVHLVPT
jgi:hypothetical protein